MTNPAKAKGDRAERAFVKWLNSQGIPARRAKAGWDDDWGDVVFEDRNWFVDVKDRKTLDVSGWLRHMEEKMQWSKREFDDAMLVIKRPGMSDPADWWVVRTARSTFREEL